MATAAHDLMEIRPDGRMRLLFHPGQWRAWESKARFVVVLAGTQSGKTALGPHWLYREMKQTAPNDAMVVAPTFQLMQLKALPEFLRLFELKLQLGTFVGSPRPVFTFSDAGAERTFGHVPDRPVHVYFGHAADPESLESATLGCAWLDEAGQSKFRLGAWEAIRRRLSLAQGRILITTTPYDLGWLKQTLYDGWEAGDPEIDVISFDSTENPMFPMEEYERMQETMPAWKFNMMYRGRFERPAGLIYDSFDKRRHVEKAFPIPDDWPRFFGLDFGLVHMTCLKYAQQPSSDRYYLYDEYLDRGFSMREHVQRLLKGEPRYDGIHRLPTAVGGAYSEENWRAEFAAAGLPVKRPDQSDVEIGIGRVYAAHRRDQIIVFDRCAKYLEEKATYARELDDDGEPTERIADKSTFHFMDAERYIIGYQTRHADRQARPAAAGFIRRIVYA